MNKKQIKVKYISTDNSSADLFTTTLSQEKVSFLRSSLKRFCFKIGIFRINEFQVWKTFRSRRTVEFWNMWYFIIYQYIFVVFVDKNGWIVIWTFYWNKKIARFINVILISSQKIYPHFNMFTVTVYKMPVLWIKFYI